MKTHLPIQITILGVSIATLATVRALASPAPDVPERPTFFRDVLPILQQNCQSCHRDGGDNFMGIVAPMALVEYDEVRPWSKSMARQAKARTMPPWHASPEFHGVFANERTLEQNEIETLVRWASRGAPKGSAEEAPPPRDFGEPGWAIGEPDLVLTFDQPVRIDDEVEDVYKIVTVDIPKDKLPEDRFIQSMEFRPGSEVVHHIVIFTTDQRESLGFGQGMLGGMGPGTDPSYFPKSFGRRLSAGSKILFNMHYHKEPGPGTAVYDQSSIAFKFHQGPVDNEVHWGAVGTMAFEIPPHAANHEVVAEEKIERDALLFALFPHTHLRGKASRMTAIYPDGDTEVLLEVPRYDFDWQTNYIYKEPKRIPAGTRIKVQMWYDNSMERAEIAGIDPTRAVRWGQPTTDEMMYGFIDYAYVEPSSKP